MKYIGKSKLVIEKDQIILKEPMVINLHKEDAIGVGKIIVTLTNNEITVVVEPRGE